MEFNKIAEAHHTQDLPVQTIEPISSPKQLQGREVKLSTITKIAIGSAAISALAFTYYAAYNYLSPINNDLPPVTPDTKGTCVRFKAEDIYNQLGPVKKDFCTDPKTIFNEIYESGNIKAISIPDMQKRFGLDQRSMTAKESREFYNVIAKANRNFGERAINDHGVKSPFLKEVAEAACETRHNAKVYVRKLSSPIVEVFAQGLDFYRHRNTTGLDCEALFKKYHNNATVIIDKAASPNNEVNEFVECLDQGTRFTSGLVSAVWEGIKNGMVKLADYPLDKTVSHLGA